MKTFQTFDISAEYDAIHRTFPCHKDAPVIGLTGNFQEGACTLLEGYFTSILKAGGIPFIIPPVDETNSLINSLNALDGLLLTGGADINPLFLGEEPIKELHSINPRRDRQELLLAKLAADRQIPILGICRGIQVMNAAFGGSLYQDIHVQMEGERIKHDQDLGRGYASHTVRIEKDSLLYKLFETEILPVNSFHHQAVKEVAPGFRVTARSSDGVIEAMESTECKSMMGVQWHPECFILENNTCMMPVFHWLIQESTSFREAKKLHSRMITLDSHCDTPMFFDQGINFATRDKKILVDLHKITEGHLDATIMVAYLKQELGQKQTVLSNLQSEYEELCISMTEKDHLQEELDALSLAGETIQSLSVQMQSRIGDRLKQQMSKTLSSLTNGRYLQVNMDENLRIGLHTADEYVPLEQVSRGTIEQAYFALRMAAMDVLCGEEELPVILDESFAFYDENRLKETLKWLAENRTQVLLFTCQKREEEALSEMGIPYRKIVL